MVEKATGRVQLRETRTIVVRGESHVIIDKSEASTAAWATRKAVEYVKSRSRYMTLTGWTNMYDEYKSEGAAKDKGGYWEVLVVGEKKLAVPEPPNWVEVESGVLAGLDSPGT